MPDPSLLLLLMVIVAALAFDYPGLGDRGRNDAAWKGFLESAKRLGASLRLSFFVVPPRVSRTSTGKFPPKCASPIVALKAESFTTNIGSLDTPVVA